MSAQGSGSGRRLVVAVVAASAVVAACGSSHPKATASPPVLLQKAKATLDSASAVHFQLSSQNVPVKGTNLTGGRGDLARPDSLEGSFDVTVSGFAAAVEVVSVNGVFEAKLPFTSGYQKTDPSKFGLTDPAGLLSPTKGLTSLLSLAQNPQAGPARRVNGELLDTISYTVPGQDIPVLPDADPSQPVQLTVAVDPSTYQLRTVTMVGPLVTSGSNSTFVVTLSGYNEKVHISLPATS